MLLADHLKSIILTYPDKPAILTNEKVITYRQFWEDLKWYQFQPGQEVKLVADQSYQAVVVLVAAIISGAVICPLDPRRHQTTNCSRWKTTTPRFIPPVPEGLAYKLQTSGTTGEPKTVRATSSALYHVVTSLIECYCITAHCHLVQFAYLSFDSALVEIWSALLSGATLVIPGSRLRDNLYGVLDEIFQSYSDVVLTLPPSVAAGIVGLDLVNVHTLVLAGEECSQELANSLYGRVENLINAYGPTEAIIAATTYKISSRQQGVVPIGQPLPGMNLELIDHELVLHSDYLALGYEGEDFNGVYHTGDLGDLVDGNYVFLGRTDNLVKINGQRISLELLERQARRQTGDPCFTVVKNGDKLYGLTTGQVLSVEVFPRLVRVIQVKTLPLTTNGKIDRQACLDLIPRDATSKTGRVGELWQKALNTNDTTSRFLEAGGNSLSALKLIALVQRELGKTLTISEIIGENISLSELEAKCN